MHKVYLRVSLIPDEEHLFSKWFFPQQTYCASLDPWIPSRDQIFAPSFQFWIPSPYFELLLLLQWAAVRSQTFSRPLHFYIATLLHCYIATVLHCYIATVLHCYIATMLHCYIAIVLHCYIATLLCSALQCICLAVSCCDMLHWRLAGHVPCVSIYYIVHCYVMLCFVFCLLHCVLLRCALVCIFSVLLLCWRLAGRVPCALGNALLDPHCRYFPNLTFYVWGVGLKSCNQRYRFWIWKIQF